MRHPTAQLAGASQPSAQPMHLERRSCEGQEQHPHSRLAYGVDTQPVLRSGDRSSKHRVGRLPQISTHAQGLNSKNPVIITSSFKLVLKLFPPTQLTACPPTPGPDQSESIASILTKKLVQELNLFAQSSEPLTNTSSYKLQSHSLPCHPFHSLPAHHQA